jgi:hypothetical protein
MARPRTDLLDKRLPVMFLEDPKRLIYQTLVSGQPLTTHGLLRETEEKLVNETLHSLGKWDSEEGNHILA